MTDFFDIHPRLLEVSRQAENLCRDAFARISENEEYNGQKVLSAFLKNGISEAHLKGTTGYGYDDRGREGLDAVFAAVRTAGPGFCGAPPRWRLRRPAP